MMYALLLLLAVSVEATIVSKATEEALYKDVFEHYNKDYHPHPHSASAVNGSDCTVHMAIEIMRLIDLDTVHQIFDVDCMFAMDWVDEDLAWDKNAYGGLESINVPANKIWIPDIVPIRSVNQFGVLSHNTDFDAHVKYTGEVVYAIATELKSYCHTQDSYQIGQEVKCPMEFLMWKHSKEEVDIDFIGVDDIDDKHKYFKQIHLDPHFVHKEFNRMWNITSEKHTMYEKTYDCCSGLHFQSAEVEFTIERYA